MVTTPPPQSPSGPAARRPASGVARWLVVALTVTALLAGVAIGVLAPVGADGLAAAQLRAQESERQVADLESRLSAATEENANLVDSRDAAETDSERLELRKVKLGQRVAELRERVQELEDAAAAIEPASDDPEVVQADDDPASTDDRVDDDTPDPGNDFDREWATKKVADIIDDIASVDERLADGVMVTSAMSMLSNSYGRLLDAGIPPGVEASEYAARVSTLEEFAARAADLYRADPQEGTAKYAVLREQTGPLFAQLNAALGTDFRLP